MSDQKGCCDEADCTRTQPLHMYRGTFSGTVYAVTRYELGKPLGGGDARFEAIHKHEITRQMVSFLRRNEAWVRGILDS